LKKVAFIFIFVISLFGENNQIDWDYELDIYYSNIYTYLNLDKDKNITDATNYSEAQIYTNLVKKTFKPNIFLIEASFHPMSWAGVWYRRHYPQKYENANIDNFNIVKALTAGWEEPYSISFFVGRMMIFKNKKSRHIGKNRAFIGYLLTIGNKSIKDNMDYNNKWINFEFKLKGTRELEDKDLDWSFRIGYRHNDNNDFVDTVYLGARRSSIDFNKSIWSLRYNSAFESMVEFSAKNFDLTKVELILEKKWPLKFTEKLTFGLGIGYLYYGGNRYEGDLKEEGIDNHQLILRPNLKW
jgi:hypothetical protein